MEMSYLRGACGVTRWKGDSDVVELVKRNTLMWLGHIERKKSEEFVMKMYASEIEELRRRPIV